MNDSANKKKEKGPSPTSSSEPDPEALPEGQNGPHQEAAAEASLEAEIAPLREEINQLKDRLLRAAAETENVRKRAQRDVEETAKYASTAFARDMVSVAENLYRALANIPQEQRAKDPALDALAQGVEMTLKELLAAFERHGIRRIDPMGEKFNHDYHQAVLQVSSPDHPPGTIVQVLQAGYVLRDRLLKPAMVGVAKAPDSENPPKVVDTTA